MSAKEKTQEEPGADLVTGDEAAPGLGTVEDQATSFRHVREARRNELVEDYVELIADLIDDFRRGASGRYRSAFGGDQADRQ